MEISSGPTRCSPSNADAGGLFAGHVCDEPKLLDLDPSSLFVGVGFTRFAARSGTATR